MRAAGPAPPPRLSRRLTPRLAAAILAVICAVAVARVTATYRVFSATADEAQHVAAGIDWWGNRFDRWRGAFMWHLMGNPPLARAAVGLRPYLAGLRPRKPADVLYNPAGQVETMRAARSAVLPFLVLLIVLTWAVARRLFGAAAGLVAAAAVSTLPPVLGHAGLATTDVAAAATYMLAFLTLARWFDSPSAGRAALFGLAFGLAFATKTSVLTLVPAAALVLVHRRLASGPPPRAARARAAVAAEL
ncbi:MAG TPA: glycosyltransferase family 39 protein, partial [Polyangia bacterium]|nr:glycosyltransferase family 39 protein [Polyangia bacterium]